MIHFYFLMHKKCDDAENLYGKVRVSLTGGFP